MSSELDPLEQHLVDELRALAPPERAAEIPAEATHAWRAQIESRAIDHAARWLQGQRLGFYTIGSAGHESNALLALALRPTDPALLHYRSGGFYLARAGQAGRDGAWDVLLGMAAAVEEPMAGGRHKVFGHHDLAVIPQTSTIASHLPRAVGIAFAIERARELGVESTWAPDAVVVCSFGDASLNHATAQSALNAAAHFAYRGRAAATSLRLRGQRVRDQRADAGGLGRAGAAWSARAGRRARGRGRSRRGARHGEGARRVGPGEPSPCRAASANRPLPEPRRRGSRDRVPVRARHPGRLHA